MNHSGLSATLYAPTSISGQTVGLKAAGSTVIFETAKDAQQDYQRVTVYLIFLFWSIMYNEFDLYGLCGMRPTPYLMSQMLTILAWVGTIMPETTPEAAMVTPRPRQSRFVLRRMW
jgi:hypothetical protein